MALESALLSQMLTKFNDIAKIVPENINYVKEEMTAMFGIFTIKNQSKLYFGSITYQYYQLKVFE